MEGGEWRDFGFLFSVIAASGCLKNIFLLIRWLNRLNRILAIAIAMTNLRVRAVFSQTGRCKKSQEQYALNSET